MQYVILIIVIFSLQFGFYRSFLSYQEITQKEFAQNRERHGKLKPHLAVARSVASVSPEINPHFVKAQQEKIDLSDFYFSRANELYGKRQVGEALGALNKIKNESVDGDNLARSGYEKIKIMCTAKMENECLIEMDYLVTQFPESNWTGKSLMYLSDFYKKNNRHAEAEALDRILHEEFN